MDPVFSDPDEVFLVYLPGSHLPGGPPPMIGTRYRRPSDRSPPPPHSTRFVLTAHPHSLMSHWLELPWPQQLIVGSFRHETLDQARFRWKIPVFAVLLQLIYSIVANCVAMIVWCFAVGQAAPPIRAWITLVVIFWFNLFVAVVQTAVIWDSPLLRNALPFDRLNRGALLSLTIGLGLELLLGDYRFILWYQLYRFGWLFAMVQGILWPIVYRLRKFELFRC